MRTLHMKTVSGGASELRVLEVYPLFEKACFCENNVFVKSDRSESLKLYWQFTVHFKIYLRIGRKASGDGAE